MNKIAFVAAVACVSCLAQGAVARNPDKPIGSDGNHAVTIPSIPVLTPGQTAPGGSEPGSSNKLSIGQYQVNCDDVGKAQIRTENITVDGHHQMVVREEAQCNVSAANQSSSQCVIQNLGQLAYLKPLTFQANNAEMLFVQVEYSTTSPNSPFIKQFNTPNGLFAKFNSKLTLTGTNTYSIPIGSGANQIPAGALMQQVHFVTFGNLNSLCTNYTTDLYNFSINGVSIPLTMSSHHSCGADCR